MYLAELLMQNEVADLKREMDKGTFHLTDLRSGKFDFYNESAITKLQNKIFQISEDLKDVFLENYLSLLQDLGRSICKISEKESTYNEIIDRLDKELTIYRNSRARYLRLNFGLQIA